VRLGSCSSCPSSTSALSRRSFLLFSLSLSPPLSRSAVLSLVRRRDDDETTDLLSSFSLLSSRSLSRSFGRRLLDELTRDSASLDRPVILFHMVAQWSVCGFDCRFVACRLVVRVNSLRMVFLRQFGMFWVWPARLVCSRISG